MYQYEPVSPKISRDRSRTRSKKVKNASLRVKFPHRPTTLQPPSGGPSSGTPRSHSEIDTNFQDNTLRRIRKWYHLPRPTKNDPPYPLGPHGEIGGYMGDTPLQTPFRPWYSSYTQGIVFILTGWGGYTLTLIVYQYEPVSPKIGRDPCSNLLFTVYGYMVNTPFRPHVDHGTRVVAAG